MRLSELTQTICSEMHIKHNRKEVKSMNRPFQQRVAMEILALKDVYVKKIFHQGAGLKVCLTKCYISVASLRNHNSITKPKVRKGN